MGTVIAAPQKAALPIDFTKVIECNRGNLLPKISVPVFHDKFDVEIENNIQIPSNNESNQVNKINNNTAPVISNLGNISVTNVLPANAKVICNLIPIGDSSIPIKNIGGNNAKGNITAKIIPIIGNDILRNRLNDNTDAENLIVNNNEGNITVAEILPTGNSQVGNIEINANNALTNTGDAKVLDKDLVTVVQTHDNVKEIVSKHDDKIRSTGLNQVATDAGNSKLLANIAPKISNFETKIVTVSNGNIGNTGLNIASADGTSLIENVQNLNRNDNNQQNSSSTPPKMYTLFRTSAGSYLIPSSFIEKTNSVTAPIVSTGVTSDNTIKVTVLKKITIEAKKHSVLRNKNDDLIPDDTHKELKDHCKCCIVLRKVCKEKQTCITDFFKSNKHKEKTCQCTDRKYPNMTKRLKLFLKNYKSNSWCVHKELQSKLKLIKKEMQTKHTCKSNVESLDDDYSLEDIGK